MTTLGEQQAGKPKHASEHSKTLSNQLGAECGARDEVRKLLLMLLVQWLVRLLELALLVRVLPVRVLNSWILLPLWLLD